MNATEDEAKKLYEVCLSGSVEELDALVEKDQLILNRFNSTACFFNDTPLHVAVLCGHLDFTRALLRRKPKLATELDSLRRSPLHIASTDGHFEIVHELLRVNTDVCISRDQDGQGRTIEYLLGIKSVTDHVNVKNQNGFTALDVVEHCPNRDLKTMEIREILMQAGVRRPEPKPESPLDHNPPPPQRCCKAGVALMGYISRFWTTYFKTDPVWLEEVLLDGSHSLSFTF
ncbi:hypothetical protein RHSIM_Rhsim02G0103800 [Rhododendron simsii]|uniref:Uncharacterized protein n=1 Tax=Rhododendron simsii TaxID=118357 RepID=A0A834HCB4_RHOSS|nr:hypothetical protein RHSIM_Rhsim02G0103800 [Rhododendron simsii]